MTRPPRPTARLLALLLVPLLVIVGTGRAQAFYLCASDLVARTACCCPQVDAAPVDAVSVVAARCCSLEERGAAAPVARSVDRDLASVGDLPIVVVATAAAPLPPRAAFSRVARWSHAPPRTAARWSQLVALLL